MKEVIGNERGNWEPQIFIFFSKNKIGSLEKGKKADFLIVDYKQTDLMRSQSIYLRPEQILSKLIYRGNDSAVKHVYIEGEKIK